jgi:hypothetical protein
LVFICPSNIISFLLAFSGPILFLAYVNNIWRNTESNIRLFADDCIIYRKINYSSDTDKLQKNLNKLGEWALENGMKINPGKSKAVRFTKARVNQLIPEANSFKYLGLIIRSDLNWVDNVNYTLRKAWKALHFILKKRNSALFKAYTGRRA